MTVGEIYDILPDDRMIVVNRYDDDSGIVEEVYSSTSGEVLPLRLWSKHVTFLDVVQNGLIVEYNKEG